MATEYSLACTAPPVTEYQNGPKTTYKILVLI